MVDDRTGDLREYQVEGTTYAPTGDIKTPGGQRVSHQELRTDAIARLAEIGAVCNDAKVVWSPVSSSGWLMIVWIADIFYITIGEGCVC